MTNPQLSKCEKCGRTSEIVDMKDCPFCHTPPVEGEWEKETSELQNLLWNAANENSSADFNTKLNVQFNVIQKFLSNLLHSEREKGRAEGYKEAFYSDEKVEEIKKTARAEERERIVKTCEGMYKVWSGGSPLSDGYNSALSDLRDKLSTP